MRSFNEKIKLFLLILFLGIFLVGCTGPIPKMEDLKGKWTAIKKEGYTLGGGQQVGFEIEFFSDNTMTLPIGKATWTILNDGRVKIEIPNMTMMASLQENLLTITMPDNQGKVIFKRQQ